MSFNIQKLASAVTKLDADEQAQLEFMIEAFQNYKKEVENLKDIADSFERLSKKLNKENEELTAQLKMQSDTIYRLKNEASTN